MVCKEWLTYEQFQCSVIDEATPLSCDCWARNLAQQHDSIAGVTRHVYHNFSMIFALLCGANLQYEQYNKMFPHIVYTRRPKGQ